MSHCFVEDSIYDCKLSFIEQSKVSGVVDLRRGLSLRVARALASYFYIFSDIEGVFSEVWHGIDAYS